MKEKFSEYYQLTESEIKKHWDEDLFCFDANVLLNLYRYTPKTRNAFFSLLEKIKDRIWIPYQAAYEYQKNRLVVINAQKEAYDNIRTILDQKKREIETKLNSFKKHPYLHTNELKKQIESAFQAISKDLNRLEENHPDYLVEDPIFEKLTHLLSQKIGDDFEQKELGDLYREGKKRYEEKLPPGYMDMKEKTRKGNRSLYGDLIVWKQIIRKANESPPSIIFVTDDLKEDWWYKFKGKTISARPELFKEFRNETKKRINIYQADKFLEYANKNLKQNTTQDAIDEVRKVRLADELELKELEMLLDDNGDLDFEEHARKLTESNKSGFEVEFERRIEAYKEDGHS